MYNNYTKYFISMRKTIFEKCLICELPTKIYTRDILTIKKKKKLLTLLSLYCTSVL